MLQKLCNSTLEISFSTPSIISSVRKTIAQHHTELLDGALLLRRTPEEHGWNTALKRKFRPAWEYKLIEHGYIRVHLYRGLGSIQSEEPSIAFWDFELQRNGSLEMRDVKRLFGIQGIVAVDPLRWTEFHSANEDRISAIALHNLSEGDFTKGIKVFEPKVSSWGKFQRDLRVTSYLFGFQFIMFLHLIFDGSTIPNYVLIPLPEIYWTIYEILLALRIGLEALVFWILGKIVSVYQTKKALIVITALLGWFAFADAVENGVMKLK